MFRHVNKVDLARELGTSGAQIDYWIKIGRFKAPTHLIGKRFYWTLEEAEKIISTLVGNPKWTRITVTNDDKKKKKVK